MTTRRWTSPLALVVALVLVSACSNGSEASGPEMPGSSTTVSTTSATTSVPGDPSTTTTDSGSTTSSSSTTATPSTTTTTRPPTTSTTQPSTTTTTAPTTTTTTLPPLEPVTFDSLAGIHTIRDFSGYTSRGIRRWQRSVPGIEDIRITSSADGSGQPALWLPPDGESDRPLLVILHSWSSGYLQHAGIPYAMWARENGWAVIAPQFRGVNDDADAIGSDLAVQDVADAIDFATSQDGVEPRRVFAVGYSGGGMMSLLVAGRYPEKVTAVAAWGPPYDLIQFYEHSVATGRHYARDLRVGCGGDPTASDAAREECLRRSPMSYLGNAREQDVAVYIGQGIYDSLLSPRQGARAFNQLADPGNRFSDGQLDQIGRGSLPDGLWGSLNAETYFGEGDPAPVFARKSSDTWLVYFDAGHDMVYEATVRWFAGDPR